MVCTCDKYHFRVFINVRESMVHKILSTTCTNGNTIIEERKTTFYVCEYIHYKLYNKYKL